MNVNKTFFFIEKVGKERIDLLSHFFIPIRVIGYEIKGVEPGGEELLWTARAKIPPLP